LGRKRFKGFAAVMQHIRLGLNSQKLIVFVGFV
jgi:hypothetical protein